MTTFPRNDAAPAATGAGVNNTDDAKNNSRPSTYETGVSLRLGPYDLLKLVAEAELSLLQKSLCYAFLKFANKDTLEAWPSVKTLGRAAGVEARAARRGLGGLVQLGVLSYSDKSSGGVGPTGRGKTHILRLNPMALRSLNPAPKTGFNPASQAVEPGTLSLSSRHRTKLNPALKTGEPSIQQPKERDKEPSGMESQPTNVLLERGCMDGKPVSPQSLRDALFQAGVRGPNLDILATIDGLTPDVVKEESENIRKDSNVRNVPAVLTGRLAERAGVSLRTTPRLSFKNEDIVKRLEQMRRMHDGLHR